MTENLLAGTAALLRKGFQVEADAGADAITLRLQGELDMSAAPSLRRDLTTAFDALPQSVTLDLRQLTFLDSTGVRVLLAARRRAETQVCAFVLQSPQALVLRVLALAGVDRLLTIDGKDTASTSQHLTAAAG